MKKKSVKKPPVVKAQGDPITPKPPVPPCPAGWYEQDGKCILDVG